MRAWSTLSWWSMFLCVLVLNLLGAPSHGEDCRTTYEEYKGTPAPAWPWDCYAGPFGYIPTEYTPTENTDLNVCVRNSICDDILVSGHRGAGSRGFWTPENSLASFEMAWKMGTDAVEFDVWDTVDGEPVIMHDSTVDRTTTGSGRVDEMTLEEIKSLRIRHFNPLVPTQSVPTFREALDFLRGRTLVDVDIKSADITRLVEIIEEKGMLEAVYIAVEGIEEGMEARLANPGVALMPRVSSLKEVQVFLEVLSPIELFDMRMEDAGPEIVGYIHAQGIKILMDALHGPDTGRVGYQTLLGLGANIILTDRLENLVPFLRGPAGGG